MNASAAAAAPAHQDCRCTCGSLLARLVPDGVELKCRRCKRTVLLGWSQIPRQSQRPEASSPESHRRARARPRTTQWLEVCDEES